jgi:hypothetical protein
MEVAPSTARTSTPRLCCCRATFTRIGAPGASCFHQCDAVPADRPLARPRESGFARLGLDATRATASCSVTNCMLTFVTLRGST